QRMVGLVMVGPVAVDYYGVGVVQGGRILGPAVEVNLRPPAAQVRRRLDTPGQQPRSQLVLMVAGTVTLSPREKDDLLRSCGTPGSRLRANRQHKYERRRPYGDKHY